MEAETPQQRLARLLMTEQQPDELVPPPANPLAPPEWLAKPTRALAEGIGNMIAMPKRAMEQGVTTEEAIPWGANMGMGMVGAPGGPARALGSGAKLPLNWRPFSEMGRGEMQTDKVLAQIQDALKAGQAPNSGVPLIGPKPVGPQPTTDEVLRAIAEALKLRGE